MYKQSRKLNVAEECQIKTDKQLSRENSKRNKDKNGSGSKKLNDSNSIFSKRSPNSVSTTSRGEKSSSTSSKSSKKSWKLKNILSKGVKASNTQEKESAEMTLPVVIEVPESSDMKPINNESNDDVHVVNSPLTYYSPMKEKIVLKRPNFRRPASSKPPLPPDNKFNAVKKPSAPAWLTALREKQKKMKMEERMNRSFDDDVNRSINTVDLDNSFIDADGKQTIISIFGKAVPLKSHTKHGDDPHGSKQDHNVDGNFSPWGVKLKPVNRESTFGNEKVSNRIITSSPVLLKRSPWKSSPKKESIKYNICPGEMIDLNNLSKSSFLKEDETPTIIPITNNNGNRSQIIILGKELLLIASRSVGSISENSETDEANILWFTPRSQIVTIGLNNEADGASICIKDGSTFPLQFESKTECFSFLQTYHQLQPLSQPRDGVSTPMSNQAGAYYTPHKNNQDELEVVYMSPQPKSKLFCTPASCSDDDNNKKVSATSVVSGSTIHEDITNNTNVAQYQRMLKSGVPVDAVRHKMTIDGVATSIQDAVLNLQKDNNHDIQQEEKKIPPTNDTNSPSKFADSKSDKETTVEKGSAKKGIAMMLDAHLKKQQNNHVPTKTNVADMLEAHLKKQQDNNVPTKTNVANMLEAHLKKQQSSLQESVKETTTSNNIVEVKQSIPSSSKSEEEEEIMRKFRTMLRFGVPLESVRHKMMLEEVDSKLIEEVVGGSSDASTKVQDNELNNEEEAIVEKFRKMKKMGVPLEAVRHAMMKENINESIIEKFLGPDKQQTKNDDEKSSLSDEEKRQIESYRKMLKIGIHMDQVRHRMDTEQASDRVRALIMKNESVKVNTPSSGSKKRKRSGLIPIHWETLSKDKVENHQSVWKSTKKPNLKSHSIDMEKLREVFQKTTTNEPRTAMKKNDKSADMARILDSQRTQNVSISLQALKQFSLTELVAIISDLDPSKQIPADRLLSLKGLLPKKEELDLIQKYNGDEKFLSYPELFFRKLVLVPRVESKIRVIETIELFKQNVDDIVSRFDILTSTCNRVMKSQKLPKLLDLVLTIGNIMNAGDAVGIKFDSLLKLSQTKSKDKSMSVLDYIVATFIGKNEREILNLAVDFPQCTTASRILITDIVGSFTSLESSVKACKTELSKMRNEQLRKGKRYSPGVLRLDEFISKSEESLSRLQSKRLQASKACKVSL